MTDRPILRQGRETTPLNEIRFWLDVTDHGVWLVAKHCADAADQRLVQIEIVDGKLAMFQQPLFARKLCEAFGIPVKTKPRIFRWRDKALATLASARRAR